MYLIPSFDSKIFTFVLPIVCCIMFAKYEYVEYQKMKIIAQEEKERISVIADAVNSNADSIVLHYYSQRVWEGDTISDEFRKYYKIPLNVNVVFVEE